MSKTGNSVLSNHRQGETGAKLEIHSIASDLSQLFEEQVGRNPEMAAVQMNGVSLSYRELNDRANQLAHYLRKRTVRRGQIVAICMNRSLEMIIGILGILKAGSTYLPLDIQHPKERLLYMLHEAEAPIVLTEHSLKNIFEDKVDTFCLDTEWSELINESAANPELDRSAEDTAYVMYTSGSTGQPKGVEVRHAGVVNLLEDMNNHDPLDAGAAYGFWTSFSFDVSVLEIFSCLLYGGTLHIVPEDLRMDMNQYIHWLQGNKIESAFVPAFVLHDFAQWLKENRSLIWPMKRLVTGVEPIRTSILLDIAELIPGLQIINGYGPTEATICATLLYFTKKEKEPFVPIGQAVQNTTLYVLDEDQKPVPEGEAGELYIAGIGVAKGYLKRPDLTAERFIHLALDQDKTERVYRTGDMVQVLPDGNLRFIGRADHQVKLRGYRIELGEIERNLIEHPAVLETVVILREDEPGVKRLVGYIVSKQELSAYDLRLWLADRLPKYMIPDILVQLESLPSTINGKIDRKALPVPDHRNSMVDLGQYSAPRTTDEEWIAQLWADLLRIERVGIEDNFFMSGGNSLLATQMLGKVKGRYNIDFPISSFFKEPTISTLSDLLQQKDSESRKKLSELRIKPVSREEILPATFAQERVWFIEQLEPNNIAYHFQTLLHLKGKLDIEILQRSLDEIVRRHEIFRTTFPRHQGKLTQQIHPPVPADFSTIDLRGTPVDLRSSEVDQHIQQELQQRFDITRLPLIRWVLLRTDDEEFYLLHIEHHLVHDGWSFVVFLRELTELYKAFHAGQPSPLSPVDIQFADFAYWQRQWIKEVEQEQLCFWKEKLKGASGILELPFDRPRPKKQTFDGSLLRIELPLRLSKKIRDFCQSTGYTLFMTMYAAFTTLLYRYTGQDDILVGTGIANRRFEETDHVIGMIVNTILLRTQLSETMTVADLLEHVKREALDVYEHQDTPFERLVESIDFERDMSRNPLCQVAFSFHDTPYPALDWPELELGLIEPLSNGSAKFDMNIVVIPRHNADLSNERPMNEEGITLAWEFNSHLFDRTTIERMISHYQFLLEEMITNAKRPLAELSLLPQQEQDIILNVWNHTETKAASPVLIHQLFEQQAEKHPGIVAVSYAGQVLTYSELNERANQLAHYLAKKGVEDTFVGVYIDRSLEMVVAIMGILKAGGAYVPLDPNYPQERIDFMIEDAQLSVLLTQQSLRSRVTSETCQVVCLDTDWAEIRTESKQNLHSYNTENRLAYAIYTSGTTGKPKGVMVEHFGLLNLVEDFEKRQPIAAGDPCSFCGGFSFDVSVYEIFTPLLNGGTLCITPEDVRLDSGRFIDWLHQQQIMHCYFPAYMLSDLRSTLKEKGTGYLSIKRMMVGVEPISEALLTEIQNNIPGLRMINAYGPAEATVIAAAYELGHASEASDRRTPIGKPIQNTQIYLLDQHLRLVPIGVPGEVYIGGAGLAQGYLNLPELTEEKFIPSPFHHGTVRLYKTGDLAKYLPNGDIEFLGRNDEQVKINGVRIELGEIENNLKTHPAVKDTAVIVHEENEQKRIVAYLVPFPGKEIETSAIYEHLNQTLPYTMMPSAYVILETLPVTANGKLDKKALPVPEKLEAEAEYLAPRNAVEEKVAEVWKEVLDRKQIGIHQNFYEAGGSSIMATQIVFKLSETFNVRMTLRDFFDQPTIEGISEKLTVMMNGKEQASNQYSVISRSKRRLKR